MRKSKLINKKNKKLADKKCLFCGESNYAVLDNHRIFEGQDGGKYTHHNTITLCSNCHRKVHASQIKIDRKYLSTSGKWLLHYWINDEEKWLET